MLFLCSDDIIISIGIETTGALQNYETLISKLFETFLDFETTNQVVPRHAGTA